MADTRTLTIVFKAEGGQLVEDSLKRIEKQGNQTVTTIQKGGETISRTITTIEGKTRSWSSALTAVNTGYLAITQSIQQATRVIGGLIDAGLEEERSLRRREVALRSRGDATQADIKLLEDQAQAYLKNYGIADDYTRSVQAQASMLGIATKNVDELTKAAIGMSEVYGGEASDNVEKLTRFVLGYSNSVKGTTIAVKDHATAQERIALVLDKTRVGFEDLDERMKTDEGQIERTKAQYDELKESLGIKLLPVVSELAKKGEEMLDWYNALDPSAQNLVAWGTAGAAALVPLSLILSNILNVVVQLKNLGWLSGAGGLAGVGAFALGGAFAGQNAQATAGSQALPNGAYSTLGLAPGGGKREIVSRYPGLIDMLRNGGGTDTGAGTVDQPLFRDAGGGGSKSKPYVDRNAIAGAWGLTGYYMQALGSRRVRNGDFQMVNPLGLSDYADLWESVNTLGLDTVLGGGGAAAMALNTNMPRTMKRTLPGPGWLGYYQADAYQAALHPGGYNEFFQYNDQASRPSWRTNVGNAFQSPEAITALAGSLLSGGGAQGLLGTAGSIAGNAIFPGLGGIIGGGLGRLLGGLFGGHKKKQNRDGQTQATAIIVQSQQFEDIKSAIIRLTPLLRQTGGGLNAAVRQISLQGQR